MAIETIRIAQVKSVDDVIGTYGPQKKITIVDAKGRFISGWIPESVYDENEWSEGKAIDLDIYKKDKYTNFKIPAAGNSRPVNSGDNVWAAINSIKTRLDAIEAFYLPKKDHGEEPPIVDQADVPF